MREAQLWFIRRLDQLPNRFEDGGYLLVMFFDSFLQFGEFTRQFFVRCQDFTQPNERTDHADARVNCDWTV